MDIYALIGLACVDKVFRKKLFDPKTTDQALRENCFRLSLIERKALKGALEKNSEKTVLLMDQVGDVWCPMKPCPFAVYSEEGANVAKEAIRTK